MSLLGINKRGKLVIGGVVAFALIATASTGLAAWVIGSQNNAQVGTDDITVSPVKDNSVFIEVAENADLSVNFGPKAQVSTGEGNEKVYTPYAVVNPEFAGTSEEDLGLSFSFTVTLGEDVENFGGVRLHLFAVNYEIDPETEEDESKTVDSADLINDAVVGNYITLPFGTFDSTKGIAELPENYVTADTLDSNGLSTEIAVTELTKEENEEVYSYTFEGVFGWGSKTDGLNPCEYFDGNEDKGYSEAKAYLEDIQAFNGARYSIVIEPILG